jgi:hypothetical protein
MEILFTLSGHPGGGLTKEEVLVDFSAAHDRVPHPATEEAIDVIWARRKAKHSRLHDGDKFRLGSVEWQGARSLKVELGLTGYREYLGTHTRPPEEHEALLQSGRQHLSCALGCEAVLSTSDGQLVLIRRSTEVAMFSGFYNGPSGHPEPGRMPASRAHVEGIKDLNVTDAAADRRQRLGSNDNMAVVQELFESVLDETVEETGISRETLGSPLLIGLMQDQQGKPGMIFSLTTNLSADEVRAVYAQGAHAESWESDRLVTLPWTEAQALLERACEHSDATDGSPTPVTSPGSADFIRLAPASQAAFECERARRANL